eukprot:3999257-Heterocapsa_arctica.AAC.1
MRPKAPRHVERACESLGAWKADGSSKSPRSSRGCSACILVPAPRTARGRLEMPGGPNGRSRSP